MPEGDRALDAASEALRNALWEELKAVRTLGVGRLEKPGGNPVSTPRLEAAARAILGREEGKTRTATIISLLKREVERLEDMPKRRDQLTVSLGLSDDLDNTDPAKLRKEVIQRFGLDYLAYTRTNGIEQSNLWALAGQIVADSLQKDRQDGSGSPHQSKRLWVGALGVGVAVIVLVAAIVIWQGRTAQSHTPRGNPAGQDLNIDSLGVQDLGLGSSVTFSVDQKDVARKFLDRIAREGFPKDIETFFADELEVGGYLLGGMTLYLELEGLSDREVTVYDIRPIVEKEGAPALGALIDIPSQGNLTRQMEFNLESVDPAAKELKADGSLSGRRFFDVQRIGLAKGHKETLVMQFVTKTVAINFRIAIDYEVAGRKYTQIVSRKGQSFRVSANLCTRALTHSRYTPTELDQLRRLRFGTIRELSSPSSPTHGYGFIFENVGPEIYAQKCNSSR